MLTTEDVIGWTASLRQITSFSANTAILNFVDRFLKSGDINSQIRCYNFCMNKIHDKLGPLCVIHSESSTSEILENLIQAYEIPQEISIKENHNLQILITMTYECVIRDKINFLPLWISICKALGTIKSQPKLNSTWQIKLVYSFSSFCGYFQRLEKLLNSENILANKQQICCIADEWESGKSSFNDVKYTIIYMIYCPNKYCI